MLQTLVYGTSDRYLTVLTSQEKSMSFPHRAGLSALLYLCTHIWGGHPSALFDYKIFPVHISLHLLLANPVHTA